ncbi:MAG: hypothetical protein M0D57_13495 [Sphingobacteriales bacterium JAD_PAG50586_3]|nr:MAG: hypothetical protein M0D57_13495 [Sphingobacteriales bacterium JAD_PAG50586_3]
MMKICFITCLLLIGTTVKSQTDSLSFIRSKRIADADLVKKREGTFLPVSPIFRQIL